MWIILISIFVSVPQQSQAQLISTLKGEEGDQITLSCGLTGGYTFPAWRGPPSLAVYTLAGDSSGTINNNAPAASRLQYASNKQDLLLSSPVIADSGVYSCTVTGVGDHTITLTVSEKSSTPGPTPEPWCCSRIIIILFSVLGGMYVVGIFIGVFLKKKGPRKVRIKVHLVVGIPKQLQIDTAEAGPGTLRAEVKGPFGPLAADIDSHTSGKSVVEFVPKEKGPYEIHLFWSDIPVVNSPFLGYAVQGTPDARRLVNEKTEFVIDRSQAGRGSPYDPKVRKRVNLFVDEPKELLFDTAEAGTGTLRAEVKGPFGPLAADIDSHTSGKSVVKFVPKKKGPHDIQLFWSDIPVVNSPFLGYAVQDTPDARRLVNEETEFVIDRSQAGRAGCCSKGFYHCDEQDCCECCLCCGQNKCVNKCVTCECCASSPGGGCCNDARLPFWVQVLCWSIIGTPVALGIYTILICYTCYKRCGRADKPGGKNPEEIQL